MSALVLNVLVDFLTSRKVYPIDEFFLELKSFQNYDFKQYATKIRIRQKIELRNQYLNHT
jgi:DNA polymerase V